MGFAAGGHAFLPGGSDADRPYRMTCRSVWKKERRRSEFVTARPKKPRPGEGFRPGDGFQRIRGQGQAAVAPANPSGPDTFDKRARLTKSPGRKSGDSGSLGSSRFCPARGTMFSPGVPRLPPGAFIQLVRSPNGSPHRVKQQPGREKTPGRVRSDWKASGPNDPLSAKSRRR